MQPNCTLPHPSHAKDIPGEDKTLKKKLLEMGSATMQSFHPLKHIDLHMCGFAFYANDPSRQMELHHYCNVINEDFIQCTVYDSDKTDARLIGIEYVISEKLFSQLPSEERAYWHSHGYDIKSASFVVPDVPHNVEHTVLKDLVHTYGKTFVLWQVDRGDVLPMGPPQLMMVATQPGEWNEKLFAQRDQRMTFSTESRLEHIKDLKMPTPSPGADAWKTGHIPDVTSGLLLPKVSPVVTTIATGTEEAVSTQPTEYPFAK